MRLPPVFVSAVLLAAAFPAHAIEVLSLDDPAGRPAAGSVPPPVSFLWRLGMRVSVMPMVTLTELDLVEPGEADAGFAESVAAVSAPVVSALAAPAAAESVVSASEVVPLARVLDDVIDDSLDLAVKADAETVSFGLDAAPVFAGFAQLDASPAAEPVAVADTGISFAAALAIPEPGMLGFVGLGLAGIAAARFRRRR